VTCYINIITRTTKRYFRFAPPPPTPGTRPLQTIPHPWARRAGLVPGVAQEGMVTGKIEPCINTVRFLLKTMLETKDVVVGNAVKSTILKVSSFVTIKNISPVPVQVFAVGEGENRGQRKDVTSPSPPFL